MPGPPIPDDVTGQELDRSVRAELRSLSAINSERVARHLVMAGRLLDEDPELAYAHAASAASHAGRVSAVREAAGITAYASGHYAEALRELRATTRMSGSVDYLPMMADCERGLGRPERALSLAASPEASRLNKAGQVELRIVAAGARADMGQLDAAVVTLQCRELTARTPTAWLARLRYAYAEALLAVGRADEALAWFQRAVDADLDASTDAAERVDELTGVEFLDALDEEALDEDAPADSGGRGESGPVGDAGDAGAGGPRH